MIKVLHSSDWHLGKQLKKIDLSEDFKLFSAWIINEIKNREIDLLIVSGDIFDSSNPSQQAMQLYYDFLIELRNEKPGIMIIVTGGNHDSPSVLDAPKLLLNQLNIQIFGAFKGNYKDLFFTLEKGDVKIVIAAVPYLRERDIRVAISGESYDDKISLTRAGIEQFYKNVNQYYEAEYAGLPFILCGHLYVAGATLSESVRDIQVGNQASVSTNIFGANASYVALGHIHKPQVVDKKHIRYSGSPFALGFDEKNDEKQVIQIDFETNISKIQSIKIPQFRSLRLFQGNFEEVKSKIDSYTSDSVLTDLAEVLIIEESYNPNLLSQFQDWLSIPKNNICIAKTKVQFIENLAGSSSVLEPGDDLHNYEPIQMFKKIIASKERNFDTEEIISTFQELMQIIEENHSPNENTISEN